MKNFRKSELIILFMIWIFATGMNLNKAYHWDDTVHLETAQWILENPLHPMSGEVYWDGIKSPIHSMNHPHLYFYMLAVWGYIFGFSEIAMHLLESIFTLGCILFTFLIAKVIIPRRALFLTALVCMSPAFVVGQNLMLDIPMLFFWLVFYYVLIKPGVKSETQRFVLAGFIAGLACLIKYTSLPLVGVMLIYIYKKNFNLIWTISIPIIILTLWSFFNYFDYGSIHIFERPTDPFSMRHFIKMGLAWLICLGSIFPYSPVFFWNVGYDKKILSLIIRIALIFILLSSLFIFIEISLGNLSVDIKTHLTCLHFLFLGNGTAIILLALNGGFNRLKDMPEKTIHQPEFILILWLLSAALFVVMFTPFMATRHVLIVLLPCTILIAYLIETHFSVFWSLTALLLTISLTLALGISDRAWANYYREKAALIRSELGNKSEVYFSGHFGWQWYAKQNGMKQMDTLKPQMKPGDYLVYPEDILQQTLKNIPPWLQLKEVKRYTDPPNSMTFFKTGVWSFYCSSLNWLPWTMNWERFPPIIVYSVELSVPLGDG